MSGADGDLPAVSVIVVSSGTPAFSTVSGSSRCFFNALEKLSHAFELGARPTKIGELRYVASYVSPHEVASIIHGVLTCHCSAAIVKIRRQYLCKVAHCTAKI